MRIRKRRSRAKEVQTDEEILQWIGESMACVYHAAATCKMGKASDGMAVVDGDAKVHGTQGLRVVDASALPFLTPGHPQSVIVSLPADRETSCADRRPVRPRREDCRSDHQPTIAFVVKERDVGHFLRAASATHPEFLRVPQLDTPRTLLSPDSICWRRLSACSPDECPYKRYQQGDGTYARQHIQPIMSRTHIVLVHGAYHQPWHLHPLTKLLQDSGFNVTVPQLPCASENPPDGGLEADVDVVRTALEDAAEQSDGIIALCHSYGGVVLSEAVAEISEAAQKKIRRLIYLAAFVPPTPGFTVRQGGQAFPWEVTTPEVSLPLAAYDRFAIDTRHRRTASASSKTRSTCSTTTSSPLLPPKRRPR